MRIDLRKQPEDLELQLPYQSWVNSACWAAAMTYDSGAASLKGGSRGASRSSCAVHAQVRDRA